MARAPPGAPDEQPTVFGSVLGSIPRMIMLYAAITALRSFAGGASARRATTASVTASGRAGALPAVPVANGFAGARLELSLYLSEREAFSAFGDASALAWAHEFDLGDGGGSTLARFNHTLRASGALARNASAVWAHIYVTQQGASPDPRSSRHVPHLTAERHHRLIEYRRAFAQRKARSLLGDAVGADGADGEPHARGAADAADVGAEPLVPHWKPSLSIALCADTTTYAQRGSIPDALLDVLALHPPSAYVPRPWVNDVWLSEAELVQINASTALLPLRVELSSPSLLRLSLLVQLSKTLAQQRAAHGDSARGAAASEELRRMLTETNPYLLLLTLVVTVLHSLFDFLAFRNDIKFWRGTKSLQGLSTRALLVSVCVHTITFLFLLDNDTSNVVLLSNGVGLLIEAWKVHKVCDVTIGWPAEGGSVLPTIRVKARGDFAHGATATYDKQAAEYVAWALLPLVVGTSIYSLSYSQHTSWYSWLLRSLVSAVYSFGFANQAPQLFINYKLKSTAHMPWKTLCFKALNTFIDDLFAFIIKMPTMHRLSCLRDDIIFVIYMYQRYAYGVDKKRANEYGQREQDEDEGDATDRVARALPNVRADPSGDVSGEPGVAR